MTEPMWSAPAKASYPLFDDPVSAGADRTIDVGSIQLEAIADGFLLCSPEMIGTPEDRTVGMNALAVDYSPVRMPIGCFLLRGEQNILIDTGFGPNDLKGLGTMVGGRLIPQLAKMGLRPEDIDQVVLTHLHEDHSGTIADPITAEPVFKNAVVLVGEQDWDYFITEQKSELPIGDHIFAALQTLDANGQIAFASGDLDVTKNLRRIAAPGHTPGHAIFCVHDGAERVLILGDAMYCPQQLTELDWSVAFDVDPALARRTRESFTRDLEHHGGEALGCHFPELQSARVLKNPN